MARDSIPWNNILDVFGQVDKPQNRPLRYVKIVFETPATLNDLPEFDEETLRRLYSLYYDGYFLDLRITSGDPSFQPYTTYDLIRRSFERLHTERLIAAPALS